MVEKLELIMMAINFVGFAICTALAIYLKVRKEDHQEAMWLLCWAIWFAVSGKVLD